MKILWIEDFGGNQSSEEKLSKAIFKTIISNNDEELTKIYTAYDSDSEFDNELPRLFQNNTIHEIVICRNFKSWVDDIKASFDFDVVLIDINLSKGSSPDDVPDGFGDNFHEKAGFYIYHEILKLGVPDDNIAFFTAETTSFNGFKESCVSNSTPFPQNVFEKKNDDYKKIGGWLKQKAETDYLILRRAIINGCTKLIEIVKKNKLEEILIYNKTLFDNFNNLSKDDIILYLTKLKNYFPLNPPKNKNHFFYSFTRELSDLWEKSKGWLDRETENNYPSIEYNFKNFCQNQMKLLRNWTAHQQLSDELTEKEIAFYFIIAMRALFNLDINTESKQYEELMLSMFKKDEFNKEEILKNLAVSYFTLRNVYAKNQNPSRSEFNKLLDEVWKQKGIKKKDSIRFFYQNFFHSLMPATLTLQPISKEEKYKTLQEKVIMFVKFEFPDLKKFPFLIELAKSIYSEAFDNLE